MVVQPRAQQAEQGVAECGERLRGVPGADLSGVFASPHGERPPPSSESPLGGGRMEVRH